jgi:predicted nuclease with TOPRIM domain
LRERRAKRVSDSEQQLEDLTEKHQDLLESYSQQSDEILRLNAEITEITTHIDALRIRSGQTSRQMTLLDRYETMDGFSDPSETLETGSDFWFSDNYILSLSQNRMM